MASKAPKQPSLIKNLCIGICGIGLGFLLIWILQSNPNLSASVLSLQEQEYMKQVSRDAGYKKTIGNIEVFITPQLQEHSELYLSFFFSSKVKILDGSITSPYHFEIEHQDESNLEIKVTDFQQGNAEEGIITVPFWGEMRDITVESIRTSKDGDSVSLGYLDTIQTS